VAVLAVDEVAGGSAGLGVLLVQAAATSSSTRHIATPGRTDGDLGGTGEDYRPVLRALASAAWPAATMR
jgi:hypothetical protein